MALDQIPENPDVRSPFGPPPGPVTWTRAIFWNERELRAGWRLLIYLLLTIVFAVIGGMLSRAAHFPQVTRTSLTAVAMFGQDGIGILAACLAAAIMAMIEDRPFGLYGLPRAGAFGARFWQGAAWGLAMIAAITALIWSFGGISFAGLALHGPAAWGYAALWAASFVVVGLFEEFLFRGYAQFTLATGLGFWPAAVALSAAFGAIHLQNGGESRVGALSVFVIGMFFCLTLRRTGNLWFAVGLHAAFDWGETFLFSVPDSGLVAPGHLLDSSLHGPRWLTGGTVGPEGSVMAFAVVALAAAAFALVYPEKDGHSASAGGDSTAVEVGTNSEDQKPNP
jgi:membrane protease YdiL (CAAX protease family)